MSRRDLSDSDLVGIFMILVVVLLACLDAIARVLELRAQP